MQAFSHRVYRLGQQLLVIGVKAGDFQVSAQSIDLDVRVGQVIALQELRPSCARELQVQGSNIRKNDRDEVRLVERRHRGLVERGRGNWRSARRTSSDSSTLALRL